MNNTKRLHIGLLIIMFALCSLVFTRASAEPIADPDLLVLGGTQVAIKNNSKRDAEISFTNAMSELLKAYGLKIKILIYPDVKTLRAAFLRKEINAIFASSIEYPEIQDLVDPHMGMKYKGVPMKQSLVVLVRKKSKGTKLTDFKGKRFSISELQGLAKMYVNTLLLREQMLEVDSFFEYTQHNKKANVAIMDVFFNRSDMTVVTENEFLTAKELNPQIGKQLRVLVKSPDIEVMFGACTKESFKQKDKLLNTLEELSQSRAVKALLGIVQAESFARISEADLQGVIDLSNEYKALKAKAH